MSASDLQLDHIRACICQPECRIAATDAISDWENSGTGSVKDSLALNVCLRYEVDIF
jgi:hypothetical protein